MMNIRVVFSWRTERESKERKKRKKELKLEK